MICFIVIFLIIGVVAASFHCIMWAIARNIEDFDLNIDIEEYKEVDFKQYYKFPLKGMEGLLKVFTDDNQMAFDWLLPYGETFEGVKQRLLDRINGYDYTPWSVKKTFYLNDNGHIVARLEEGEQVGKEMKILVVRGWGMLTGVGGYHLPAEEAVKIQDAFTNHILKCLND